MAHQRNQRSVPHGAEDLRTARFGSLVRLPSSGDTVPDDVPPDHAVLSRQVRSALQIGPGWDRVGRLLAVGGWPARIAYRLGLQGRVLVERYTVAVAAWNREAPPIRLVYASDFHAGLTTDPRLLRQAIDVLVRAQADVLLLGGDYVSFRSRNIDALAPLLSAVPARLGRYAVLGNHDYTHGSGAVVRGLERAGIIMLTNRHVEIGVPGQPLSLCGLDDDLHGRPDPALAFAGAGPVTVLLMHSPSGLLAVQGHAFRLAICGHIHGGQIAPKRRSDRGP